MTLAMPVSAAPLLRETPFHVRTAPLIEGGTWRRWAGHLVASSYELSHEREYHAIRSSAALLDVSPLFKYLIRGRDAARLLDRVVTRRVSTMKVGQVVYTPWCDGRGKVIDDGTISRLEESIFRLTSADPNLRWLTTSATGMQVELEDVSDRVGALALQGPLSREILGRAGADDIASLKYFRVMPATLGGAPVTISRTGYTGDLGYEIWLDCADAERVWDTLIDVGTDYGITPCGILALDIARIEAGLLLGDVDYISAHKALIGAQTSSPFELNLGWAVALEKPWFTGRAALAAEQASPSGWRFVGIDVAWESLEQLYAEVHLPPKLPTVAWRISVPLYDGGKQVGYASSGCWSPLLKQYIALAHVQGAKGAVASELEMEVTVEHRRKRAAVRVVGLPFLELDRRKS